MRWLVGHVTWATAETGMPGIPSARARPTGIAQLISGQRAEYVWRLRAIQTKTVRRGLILDFTGLGAENDRSVSPTPARRREGT